MLVAGGWVLRISTLRSMYHVICSSEHGMVEHNKTMGVKEISWPASRASCTITRASSRARVNSFINSTCHRMRWQDQRRFSATGLSSYARASSGQCMHCENCCQHVCSAAVQAASHQTLLNEVARCQVLSSMKLQAFQTSNVAAETKQSDQKLCERGVQCWQNGSKQLSV